MHSSFSIKEKMLIEVVFWLLRAITTRNEIIIYFDVQRYYTTMNHNVFRVVVVSSEKNE